MMHMTKMCALRDKCPVALGDWIFANFSWKNKPKKSVLGEFWIERTILKYTFVKYIQAIFTDSAIHLENAIANFHYW